MQRECCGMITVVLLNPCSRVLQGSMGCCMQQQYAHHMHRSFPCHMKHLGTRRHYAARWPSTRSHAQPPWHDVDALNAGKSWTEQRGEEINSQVCELADVDRTAELLIWVFNSLFSRKEPANEEAQAVQAKEDNHRRAQDLTGTTPLVLHRRPDKAALQELSSLHILGVVDSKQE